MPRSKTLSQAFAMTSSSCSRPTGVKMGRAGLEMAAGLALCATAQMEQEADSVWLGWLWVDSAATVHNIRDRQSHASHRE
jgi:hypothetical protein